LLFIFGGEGMTSVGNHLKTPLNQSLNIWANGVVSKALEIGGKSLPARVVSIQSSGIVTVAFEVDAAPQILPTVEVPLLGSRYVRYPVQIGDMGFVIAADARLGGVSGLGSGVAPLAAPGNLSALVFAWIGNTNWPSMPDTNAVVLSGPNGVIAQTDDATHVLAVSESGVNIDGNIKTQGSKAGFFGATPVTKQTVTGLVNSISDANAKIVIKSILLALKTEGLITDGTT
jgi:hypothetical protein